jgi:hypothetical protein
MKVVDTSQPISRFWPTSCGGDWGCHFLAFASFASSRDMRSSGKETMLTERLEVVPFHENARDAVDEVSLLVRLNCDAVRSISSIKLERAASRRGDVSWGAQGANASVATL